jgi:hypothetical protein
LIGRVGAVSGTGSVSGTPYTAAVDEKTKRATPFATQASIRLREAALLLP